VPDLGDALTPLLLTLKVAAWASLIAFVFGLLWAYLLTRYRVWGRELFDAAFTLPMVLPPTVLGYYLLVLVGRRSALGSWLEDSLGIRLIFTWQGAALAASIVAFPLVFKAARAALEDVEHQLEKAARLLGASETKVFFRVTLPLAWRGILAGTMLAFARAMGEFGATLMIAGSIPGKTQTMSIAIYEAVQAGRDELANFLVMVTSLVCIAVLLASGKLLRPRLP
jgi:molybdate transport system permease protein